ncbi:MAG: 16S rRNA (guanine(527)-N(7))-methyltransferase RsmG [Pseudomonadota bacterium]
MSGNDGPIINGAGRLGVTLDDAQVQQFERLVTELLRWNKAYNLTAITDPDLILTHHLLDSLSVHPELVGNMIADVGTGAGFPGLPLAITNPQRTFTLIDAVDKKLRFVDHAARELGLTNVRTRHARVEQLHDAGVFDTVVARAYAPMPRLLPSIATLCGPHTKVVAMKGRWPPAPGSDESGPFPAGWQLEVSRRVDVPGLDAERHLLVLRQHLPDTHSHL